MDVPRGKSFRENHAFPVSWLLRRATLRRVLESVQHKRDCAFRAFLAAVISSCRKPVSAKQNLSSPRSRGLLVLCQLLGVASLFLPARLRAESLEDAAHELAMKVCLAAHKQPVRVVWQEAPSSVYLSDARKKAFLDQISACGMDARENSDAPVLSVTIEVTPSKALLIADSMEAANGPQIYVVEIPRASLLVPKDAARIPQLKGDILWRQEKPIQSAIEWHDAATQERFLFLLSEGQFLRFHFENSTWKWLDSAEFPPGGRRSRIGEVSLFYNHAKERVELLLGKKVCELGVGSPISFTCGGGEFRDKGARLLSSCEESPRYLLAGKGDYTQTDRLRLVLTAATAPDDESDLGSLEMPGPVLDVSVAEDSRTAIAVVKNLSTGNYEVYRITAVCSN